jgi:hypothetical protein
LNKNSAPWLRPPPDAPILRSSPAAVTMMINSANENIAENASADAVE